MTMRIAVFSALLLLTGASCVQGPQTFTYDNYGDNQADTQPKETMQNEAMTKSTSTEGPVAVMKTNMGDIRIQLFQEATPKTVANFVKLVNEDFYDGTLFHRVIPDFMIQGGDPNTKSNPDDWSLHGTGGPGYKFEDEFSGHKNTRGKLSMANSGPNTNGSQFFIITADATPWLDGKHAVFGEVIEGMDIVDKISMVETNGNDHPLEDVKILDIVIE